MSKHVPVLFGSKSSTFLTFGPSIGSFCFNFQYKNLVNLVHLYMWHKKTCVKRGKSNAPQLMVTKVNPGMSIGKYLCKILFSTNDVQNKYQNACMVHDQMSDCETHMIGTSLQVDLTLGVWESQSVKCFKTMMRRI